MALHDLIKKYAIEHQRIIFNGNGYSDEWVEEAERRGLPNIRSMVEAIPALVLPSTISMFEEFGVFTEAELRSRAEIKYENYAKAINIEARTMIDMASKQFIPAVIKYTKELADTVVAVKNAGAEAVVQMQLLGEVTMLLEKAKKALDTLVKVADQAALMAEGKEQAEYYYLK